MYKAGVQRTQSFAGVRGVPEKSPPYIPSPGRYIIEARAQEETTMNQNIQTINQMRAITISREYGSGGGEIATRLARHLGWQLIDHEIVERVASEMGTSIEEAEAHDERTEGILIRA